MMPSANRGAGLNVCAPDVCLTPPAPGVPVPYVNMAPHAVAVPFSPHVNICMLPALNIASTVPVTFGDDPGVLHPVDKDPGFFPIGAPNIFIDMIPATHMTLPTTGNMVNAPVGAYLVPDVVNVMFNDAGAAVLVARCDGQNTVTDARPAALSPGEVEALAARLRGAETATLEEEEGCRVLRIPLLVEETPAVVYSLLAGRGTGRGGEGAEALVMDLRDCPGGDLDAALRLAGEFLRAGEEIARIEDEDGDEVVRRAAADGPYRMPVTILVNRATASAAEVLAGGLLANGRARVVGGPTCGKASVQEVGRGEGGALYGTTARCLLPGGGEFDGIGIG
ncbi:MAG: S41 family peptidase [Polyangiaceae bacterium]